MLHKLQFFPGKYVYTLIYIVFIYILKKNIFVSVVNIYFKCCTFTKGKKPLNVGDKFIVYIQILFGTPIISFNIKVFFFALLEIVPCIFYIYF